MNYQVSQEDLAFLKSLRELAITEKTVSGPVVPPNHIYGHGAGGLFNTPAAERGLFSAVPLPRKGLAAMLPVFPSQNTSPQVGIITGVTETDDDPATNDAITGECGRGPSSGVLKYCVINDYPFGDYSRTLRSINIRKAGRMANRVDTMDYMVQGDPFNAGAASQSVPSYPGLKDISNVANNEAAKALFELGVAWARDFARDFYTGNPAGAFFEWSQPYRGLDLLINDGYSDIVSGNLCTRVDSYVTDFKTLMGTATSDVESNPNEIVQAIVEIFNLLHRRASQVGLDPARWVLAMPYNLFRQLAYLWPCSHYTAWCTPSTGYTGNMSAEAQYNLTQRMLSEKWLPVGNPDNADGRVMVVCDDAMTESAGDDGGDLSSSIKFVCTHVLSATVVTYMEYFDYNGQNGAMQVANQLGMNAHYQTYDNGRFLAHFIAPEGTCVSTAFYMEPRLRVDTPFLCASLNDVEYSPIIQQDSAFPGDATYLDGGNTGPNPGAEDTCRNVVECAESSPGVVDLTLDGVLECTDAPFNENVLITIKSGADAGTIVPGYITTADDVNYVYEITFGGVFAALTCAGIDTFVGAEICCTFGDPMP